MRSYNSRVDNKLYRLHFDLHSRLVHVSTAFVCVCKKYMARICNSTRWVTGALGFQNDFISGVMLRPYMGLHGEIDVDSWFWSLLPSFGEVQRWEWEAKCAGIRGIADSCCRVFRSKEVEVVSVQKRNKMLKHWCMFDHVYLRFVRMVDLVTSGGGSWGLACLITWCRTMLGMSPHIPGWVFVGGDA